MCLQSQCGGNGNQWIPEFHSPSTFLYLMQFRWMRGFVPNNRENGDWGRAPKVAFWLHMPAHIHSYSHPQVHWHSHMNAHILKHTQKNYNSQLFLENELLLSPFKYWRSSFGGGQKRPFLGGNCGSWDTERVYSIYPVWPTQVRGYELITWL